jgi:hypothetical protein
MYQECRHIKASGSKCKSPALKAETYCYYHFRASQRIVEAIENRAPYSILPLELPLLEDRAAVQVALSEVVHALAAERIELKRASLLIYALQVASSNAKNAENFISAEQVRDSSRNELGQPLAPEPTGYDTEDPEYLEQDVEGGEYSLPHLFAREFARQREAAAARKLSQTLKPVEAPDNFATNDESSDYSNFVN